MKRRQALGTLSAGALAWLAPAARGAAMKHVAYLSQGSDGREIVQALGRLGWSERSNLRFEVRIASDREPGAAEVVAAALVRSSPDVLIGGLMIRTLALMRATRTIPIVCAGVGDPVAAGLAVSEARPGYNVTGLSNGSSTSMRMLAGLLRQVLPSLERIVLVRPPMLPQYLYMVERHRALMGELGLAADVAESSTVAQTRALLSRCDPARDALVLINYLPDSLREVIPVATRRRLVLVGLGIEAVGMGALLGFALDFSDRAARIANVTDKLLRGANPADLPFEIADRAKLAVNRVTAAALGIKLPDEIMLRATEVVG